MRSEFRHFSRAVVPLIALAGAAPLAAQQAPAVSQPVVQPLPPPQVESLDVALRRLAHHPRDLDALIAAGNASLQLNDVDAAVGFFNRAQEVSPGDPRTKLGLAGAYLRSERPIEALRLFDEAAAVGTNGSAFAGDRGLAYDLVGDNAAAQAQYRLALSQGENEDVIRRLALSLAIAGDREGFEKTLYPLLAKQDFAGFRARAFGLAILGQEEEAVAIAEAVMSPDLAARIAPYLRYMRRLTKAQQAAAANLGAFPRAAQIGRDDPRIAAYSASAAASHGADARLVPSGRALGPSDEAETEGEGPRGRPDRGSSTLAPTREVVTAASRPFDQRTRIVPQQTQQTATTTSSPAQDVRASAELPPVIAAAAGPSVAVSEPVVQRLPATTDTQSSGELGSARQTASSPVPPPPVKATESEAVARPGIGLGASPAAEVMAAETSRAPAAEDPPSVADAFAGFTLAPSTRAAPAAGAVDITAIKPPREVEEKPPVKPAPPKHPSRFWVQVATGKDLAALKWDWRRISRKAPEILGDFKPMTTPWVEANRLLAGPYKTEKAADEAVSALRKAGLDSFEFTSEDGQAIEPLD